MRLKLQLFFMKFKLSFKNLFWLLQKYNYLALAILAAIVFFEFVYWVFNLNVLSSILFSSNVSTLDKLDTLISPFTQLADANGSSIFMSMILLSMIQGIAIAGLIYVIKNQDKPDAKLIGGGSFVGLLAIIGLGCPACGTSLLTPLLALVVSGSAVSLSEVITRFTLPLSIVIGIYGLYVLGQRLAALRAKSELQ